MNRLWLFTILSCFLFLSGGIAVAGIFARNRLDIIIDGDDFTKISNTVVTSFVPKHDYLNVVVVAFKNPDFKSSDTFYFGLLNEKNELLRRIEFSGKNIQDPSNLRFQFDPLTNVAGKELKLRIEPKTTLGEHPISYSSTKDGRLAMATYYRLPGRAGMIYFVLNSLAERMKKDLIFFAIWGGMLVSILFVGRKIK